MHTTVGKQYPHVCPHSICCHEDIASGSWLCREGGRQSHRSELSQEPLTHPLISMFGYSMGNLVTHNNRQSGFIACHWKDACVNSYFSPGHAPGIDRFIILNQIELPLIILDIRLHPGFSHEFLRGPGYPCSHSPYRL